MYKNDVLDKKILNSVNYNLNGSAIRNVYLRKATEAFDAGNISESIFYQTEALCMTAHSKFFLDNKLPVDLSTYIPDSNSSDEENKSNNEFENNRFIKSCENLLKSNSKYKKAISPCVNRDVFYEKDPIKGYQNIIEFCEELPNEWTVVQICKEHNPNTTFSLHSEIISNENSIFLTVLKYPYDTVKSKMKPFCIRIENTDDNNIFLQFIKIITEFEKKLRFNGVKNEKNEHAQFWQNLMIIEHEIEELLVRFKEFIGHWIGLLSGNICSEKQQIQNDIFKLVDDFVVTHNLNDDKRNILNLIVRQINLLDRNNLNSFCEYLTKNENNEQFICEKLLDFLNDIKSKFNLEKIEFSPCILIVDELVDHFFWEMLNPKQEFCRISSFHILKRLFNEHKNRLHNGYLQIPVKNGHSIINPDKTLGKMEQRMTKFFKYWLPDWNCSVGEIPTSDNFLKFLQTSDCVVYCGHGSALQFLNGDHIAKLVTKSIIFLFGCESVRLKSDGLHSEMTASHIYYHAALCPAIIGNLLSVLDCQSDIISTNLLSIWLPGKKRKKHWLNLDKTAWKAGGNISESNLCDKNSSPEHEPKLTKVLSHIRSDTSNRLYIRISIILRGLPINSE